MTASISPFSRKPLRHRRRLVWARPLVVCAALALPLVTSCSSEARNDLEDDARSAVSDAADAIEEAARDASEAVARTIAAEQGEEQFRHEGHPIEGALSCTADATELDEIAIRCTGTTEEGGAAE